MPLPAICMAIYGRDISKIWVAALPIWDSIVFDFFVLGAMRMRFAKTFGVPSRLFQKNAKVQTNHI